MSAMLASTVASTRAIAAPRASRRALRGRIDPPSRLRSSVTSTASSDAASDASAEAPRASLEERLAAALAEDTALPANPNPLEVPPLPDLRELAKMANLELTDEEVEDWTPKVHGVLSWMGKLNEVDLAAVESQVELYRDTWRMPLREDVEVDFDNRDAMFAECKTWEKPYVRVRKVDVKEGDAAAAAAAAESDDDADPTGAGSNPTDGAQVELTPELLGMELLVGKVVSVEKHPDADKLYVERVDCAEADGPRTICSGLVPYMSAEDILGKNVVVVANLKPRNMAGIKSAGMLLCANDGGDGDDRKVELLVAPEGAVAGERLTWGGAENDSAHGANKVAKKKIWEKVQPDLVTGESCEATWNGTPLESSAGVVACASLKGGGIS